MARKRDRFFALMGALLFLVTASTLTIAVIFEAVTSSDQPPAEDPQMPTCQMQPVVADKAELPKDYQAKADQAEELQTKDLVVGKGAAVKAGDCLQVKYYGTLAKDGTLFDQNYDQSTGLQFPVGQGMVIPGWDQGLIGMQPGGVRRLVIPAELAYGSQGQGEIPPNATLVFLVKLLSIEQQ